MGAIPVVRWLNRVPADPGIRPETHLVLLVVCLLAPARSNESMNWGEARCYRYNNQVARAGSFACLL